jgi:hypothetical protein
VGHRLQGIVLHARPSASALDSIAALYPCRLFELTGSGIWILDLGVQPQPDRATTRAARTVASSYVDAIRVLDAEEHDLEQLGWLVASANVARLVDDTHLDFAVIARPDGISVIGDHVPPYLIRFDLGQLTIQPYLRTPGAGAPPPPEELSLIASVSLLPAEPLQGGYPLHGNVAAEMFEFAAAAGGIAGDDAALAAARKGIRLIEARGLESSCWDG